MKDPLVKATPVNSLATYVRSRLGDSRTDSLVEGMGGDARRFFTGHLLAHEQVPLSLVNEFTSRAAESEGEEVEVFAHSAGRYGAEQGLRSVYKFIMVLLSPESVLKTAPLMWKKVYDSGEMDVAITGDKRARITVRNFPADPAGCNRITGWFEVIGQKSADAMQTEHDQCKLRGAEDCSWAFAWK